jgi:metal-responsive CopG/Arc/MetJ family transcriptional regulator
MSGQTVVLRLNQQQLELLDRTITHGAAADRAALVRRALREYLAAHPEGDSAGSTGSPAPQK